MTTDLQTNWVPLWNCKTSHNCWCEHVKGDADKDVNPDGWKQCEVTIIENGWRTQKLTECPHLKNKSCDCYTSDSDTKPCLYGHMSPGKLLYVIALARAAGATHIIEEGREGGLSAYSYNHHGLKVTSVEYAPLHS